MVWKWEMQQDCMMGKQRKCQQECKEKRQQAWVTSAWKVWAHSMYRARRISNKQPCAQEPDLSLIKQTWNVLRSWTWSEIISLQPTAIIRVVCSLKWVDTQLPSCPAYAWMIIRASIWFLGKHLVNAYIQTCSLLMYTPFYSVPTHSQTHTKLHLRLVSVPFLSLSYGQLKKKKKVYSFKLDLCVFLHPHRSAHRS